MDGNAQNSDQTTLASQACFRFWFGDATAAEAAVVAAFGANALPIALARDGCEFVLGSAKDGIGSPQYIAANPVDLPKGPSIELTVANSGACKFPAMLRTMTGIAAQIAALEGAAAVGWTVSGTVCGAGFFSRVAGTWLDGGAFPAMVLVALQGNGEGGLVTKGLEPFGGQEVWLDLAPLPMPEQAKIAIRMVDHLVTEGPVTDNEIVEVDGFGSFEIGPRDSGKKIYLRKSPFP